MGKYTFFRFCLLLVISISGNYVKANHIVGGELKMKSSGSNNFEISLIQYWDKKNLTIPTATKAGNRDGTAELYIYSKKDNTLMDRLIATYRSTTQIEYQNKACATSRSLETLTGIYTGTVSLSPQKYSDSQGYYIVWERCCRNDDINNITNPGENGMVFYLEFPPINLTNSSPEFQPPNGQYICIKRDFSMNMSATDADGDELRYSLVTPMRGNTSPAQPKGDNSKKSGYPLVTWSTGISIENVIPGTKPLSINKNGILNVTADRIGLFVFTVQCEEYRNGKMIGLVRRDFQLLVIDCNDDTPAQPIVTHQSKPVKEVIFCTEKPVELQTESAVDWSYQWQINGLNIAGATSATMMVKDTGNYTVVKSFSKKCSKDTSSSIVHVAYRVPVEAIITADKLVICKGETSFLLANGGSLTNDLICSWSLNNKSLSSAGPKLEVQQPGFYELLITDQNLGCTGKDTITISLENISVKLPEKSSVIEGSKITLKPEITPPDPSYIYQWSPQESVINNVADRDLTIAPLLPISYTIQVTSKNGCSAEATIKINVIDKMHIPTAFSPNGDGTNDLFEIFNAKDQIVNLKIFNRWGEVIYESDGYNDPWNGTYKNEPVASGSYPYIIKTELKDFKGVIFLMR